MSKPNEHNNLGPDLFTQINGNSWLTKGIFSEHYLRERLKTTVLWPNDADIQESFYKCRSLVEKNRFRLNNASESDTRKELIDVVLGQLGFSSINESPIPGESRKRPDYLLFENETKKETALALPNDLRYAYAMTICEEKSYGTPLSGYSSRSRTEKLPSLQCYSYLSDVVDQANQRPYFKWAILTNGAEWRLYGRDFSSTSCFSIDLEEAVKSQEQFKYFWLIFHSESFVKNENGSCRLDEINSESLSHQAELERNLRIRIDKVLVTLGNGYFQNPKNKIKEVDLDDLYKSCLIYLYRLLFVLFAEGRGLLPTKRNVSGGKETYVEEYSLYRLRVKLFKSLEKEDDVFDRMSKEVDELFLLINGENEKLNARCNITRYNGGLFDPNKYPLLEKWKIGNYTLTEVLKGLVFTPIISEIGDNFEVNFDEYIDYHDLEIRQLGSIYEGLLEDKFTIVEKSNPARLKIEQTSEERKETGSYYTPDYIVRYILEQTLRPIIREIEQSEAVRLAKENNLKDNSFANLVLEIKLLDPSMGSGHFLVRATEFLADEIALNYTTEEAVCTAPPGVAPDDAETAYWRRRVVENCIYGVDKNQLAVELAKLSLWLTCISSDQPLNFLDHHLRGGNSLVGSRIGEFSQYPTKKGSTALLFDVKGLNDSISLSVEEIAKICALKSDNIAVVKQKEEIYTKKVREELSHFRAIADLRTSLDMGADVSQEAFFEIGSNLNENRQVIPTDALPVDFRQHWENAKAKISADSYFHWDLEFPEIFQSKGGFDAIIGNPPYVRQETLGELKRYLAQRYKSYMGTADLYVYFIERSLELLKPEGRLGLIVSNKWMRARYGQKIRELVKKYRIEKLVDFGELKVFEGSATFPLVMIVAKTKPNGGTYYAPIRTLDFEELEDEAKVVAFDIEEDALAVGGFYLAKKDLTDILGKIKSLGTPLGEYVDNKIYYGIKTGFNEAFVINGAIREKLISLDSASEEIIKPFVNGDDVRHYKVNFRDRYLIFTRHGVDIEEYVAVKEYLEKWKPQLSPKATAKETNGRKPGSYKWYEIQDTINYYAEFEKPKIVWPEIAKESRFAWDNGEYYYNATSFLIPSADLGLLGILNSKLVWGYLKRTCAVLGDPDRKGRLRQRAIYVKTIPIVKTIANPRKTRMYKTIGNLAKQIIQQKQDIDKTRRLAEIRRLEKAIDEEVREIDALVYELYDLTAREIEIIEASV